MTARPQSPPALPSITPDRGFSPAARAPATGALPAPVARAIAASGLPPQSFGLYAQEVVGPRTVLALNAEQPYTMASTTRVVTSLAALDLLGPYCRWHTSAFALGTLADGRLVGDLLIVGGGNAQLSSAALAAWFRRLHDQGLRVIDGDIVLDRYAFQLAPSDHAGTPLPSAGEPRQVWLDAMTLDEGRIRVVVRPARGPRAALSLQPVLSDVTLDNRVATGCGCSATPRWQAGRDGRATIIVQGHWDAACGTRSVSFVPPPDSGIAGTRAAGAVGGTPMACCADA